MEKIRSLQIPVLLALNKIDLLSQEVLEERMAFWKKELPQALHYPISALHRFNVPEILDTLIQLLPESPPFYPKDQLTDRPQRFFVNEIIREKILLYYQKEIPYAVEVETETFTEGEQIIKIRWQDGGSHGTGPVFGAESIPHHESSAGVLPLPSSNP